MQAENNALKERLNPSLSPASVNLPAFAMSPVTMSPVSMQPVSMQPTVSMQPEEIFPSAPNSPNRYVGFTSMPSSPKEEGQQLHTGFSNMSVSSSSSVASTPYYTQSIYIPQPPQLYNHHQVFNTQQPQQHKQQGLRPLLPATSFLPALRMGGYEKIYGNVCRY